MYLSCKYAVLSKSYRMSYQAEIHNFDCWPGNGMTCSLCFPRSIICNYLPVGSLLWSHCSLVAQVDTQFGFQAKCKGEIGAFGWFAIKDLPATAESARLTDSTNSEMSYKMYQVLLSRFMKPAFNVEIVVKHSQALRRMTNRCRLEDSKQSPISCSQSGNANDLLNQCGQIAFNKPLLHQTSPSCKEFPEVI